MESTIGLRSASVNEPSRKDVRAPLSSSCWLQTPCLTMCAGGGLVRQRIASSHFGLSGEEEEEAEMEAPLMACGELACYRILIASLTGRSFCAGYIDVRPASSSTDHANLSLTNVK